jgi:lipopolysaccharide transport system permease protein
MDPALAGEKPMPQIRIYTPDPPSMSGLLNPLTMLRKSGEFKDLLVQLTRREIAGRYRGTYLGILWSVISPLMTLIVYTLVFGVILNLRFGTAVGGGRSDFVINFFAGLIVYNVFASCASRAPLVIINNPNFVKRVVFPLEVIPMAVLGASFVDLAIGLLILFPVHMLVVGKISSTFYLFPLVLIPLCALSLGIGWLTASAGVFLRDMALIMTVLLNLLFFLTPVIYPLSAVPVQFQIIMRLNPLTTIIEDARRTLLLGLTPEWGWWLAVTMVSLVIMQIGYAWFIKSKRIFADVV